MIVGEFRAYSELEVGQYVTCVSLTDPSATLVEGNLDRTYGVTQLADIMNLALIQYPDGVNPTAVYHLRYRTEL